MKNEDMIRLQEAANDLAINTLSPLMSVYRKRDEIETAEVWGYSETQEKNGWKKVTFWYRESK